MPIPSGPLHPELLWAGGGAGVCGLVLATMFYWRFGQRVAALVAVVGALAAAQLIVGPTYMWTAVLASGAFAVSAWVWGDGTRGAPVMVVVSLVGVWAAVPDTEVAVVVGGFVGVIVAGSFLFTRVGSFRGTVLGQGASGAVLASVVLVPALAGASNVQLVGAVGCLGFLNPLCWSALPQRPRRVAVLTAGHVPVVLVASRVITRWDLVPALVATAMLWGCCVALLRWGDKR